MFHSLLAEEGPAVCLTWFDTRSDSFSLLLRRLSPFQSLPRCGLGVRFGFKGTVFGILIFYIGQLEGRSGCFVSSDGALASI